MFFFLFNLFLWQNIPPVSPEAEVGSCMEKTPTSKPRQSDMEQMNEVQSLIWHLVTLFSIGGLSPLSVERFKYERFPQVCFTTDSCIYVGSHSCILYIYLHTYK